MLTQSLTPAQEAFLGELLRSHDLPQEAMEELEVEFCQPEVAGIELILPPGCRSVEDMHRKIEKNLIWVPGCGD
jgi:hypothetical protein